MAEFNYFILDAFTAQRYAGNPAAVVLDADGLTDDQMCSVAREFNLSETTFVLKPTTREAPLAIRWFTPTTEVDMCGHGTIAAVHALIHSGRYASLPDDKGAILPIQTRRAVLTVGCERLSRPGPEAFLVWLDLPSPTLTPKPRAAGLWSELLGVPADAFDADIPPALTQDGDMLVFCASCQVLMDARPDFAALAKLSRQHRIRGWCLATMATLTPSIHVQSRFFAPAVGINEDPVTGSVHGPLAAHLVACGRVPEFRDTAVLMCTQSDSSGRAGLVRAVVVRQPDGGFRVRIGGECIMVMQGKLFF